MLAHAKRFPQCGHALEQMVGEELGEAMLPQARPHEPLKDVHVRVAVPFDDHRSVRSRRNVPADHDPVREVPVRRKRECLDL
jgi:hypothetical protein